MATIDRHQARILAVQAACQLDVQGDGFLKDLDAFLIESNAETPVCQYGAALVRGMADWKTQVDQQIGSAAEHWRVERLSLVDRAVLRVAVAELLQGQVPAPVIIDEAIEIGREFGGKDSPTFINGVLDRIWRKMKEEAGQ